MEAYGDSEKFTDSHHINEISNKNLIVSTSSTTTTAENKYFFWVHEGMLNTPSNKMNLQIKLRAMCVVYLCTYLTLNK